MITKYKDVVINELDHALSMICEESIENLIREILKANKVLVVGVGRVLISMKAWVKRFSHLNININYVGSETEMPVSAGDLVIVTSASGESAYPLLIEKLATEKGVKTLYIGCTPQSTAATMANLSVILAGKTKFTKSSEAFSRQPMSTLFEQQLYLLCDIITLRIMELKGWDEQDIKNRHANLE